MSKLTGISPMKRFFNLLKVDRQEIMSIYVYSLFSGLVALSLPLGIQAIINLISGGQVSTSWIILVAFVILGVALNGVMQIMQLTISENLQQKLFTRSAFEFAYRIPRLQLETVEKKHIPELVNRFFDTLSIQKGLSKILLDFSGASLQVLFGLLLLSLYHPFFIMFSLILLLIVYLIIRISGPKGLSTSIVESTFKYEVVFWLEEVARAMETFKLAGNSSLPMTKTDDMVAGYLSARKEHFKTLRIQYISLVGFKVIVATGLLLIGGLLVINQKMNIGQFVAAEIIIIMILNSVEKLILSMETIYDVLTAIEKLGAVTDLPLERDTGFLAPKKKKEGISVRLHNLSFRFPDTQEDILKNISLEIAEGEKICLSGTEGSGKSLLLQIIAGLYDNHRGSVSYNGVPLGNWNKESLHSRIGDNLGIEDIFQGSIFENISLGRPNIKMDEVQKMSQTVGLHKFVESLPFGYETMLFPGGKNLPKSVRLKLMLARSIVGNPCIILLEDNFNQLNEPYKGSFLTYLLEGKHTVIAVSNDLSTVKVFDKVIAMDHGQIVGEGNLDSMIGMEWYNKILKK